MSTPQAVHHSLLRPTVLHILRAAGYHGTKPSVLDTLTDIAGRFMLLLANSTAEHAVLNGSDFELTVEDVRMAMQDCGAIAPEKVIEDQLFDGEEDTRGVDAFLDWARGEENKEIRRIALEGGDDGKEDYLTALKKKHDKIGDETRYHGTLLGKAAEQRAIMVEGGEASTLQEWEEKLRINSRPRSLSFATSRHASSELSDLEDEDMEGMELS